jgi:hypothetical protein
MNRAGSDLGEAIQKIKIQERINIQDSKGP